MFGTSNAFRLILSCLVTLAGALTSWSASALPSMARQTGSPCSQCHTVFPELTPYGRQFKLGAFSATSSNWAQKEALSRIPLSAAVQLSRTKTRDANAAMGDGDENPFENDGRAIVQTVAGYYGGRIANNMGALVQGNYEGAERRWAIEMADIRYARDTLVGTRELTYGVTLNNTPTVTDIYNSTPSWRFPHTESLSPVMPARTLVDMSLASQVAGVSTYAMWDSSIYAEVGLYGAANKGALRIFSAGVPKETILSGGAPYWRLAYQNELDNLSYSVGTYGMSARVRVDNNDSGAGSDRLTDYGVDGNLQWIEGRHAFSLRANWIGERQSRSASQAAGRSSGNELQLRTLNLDAHYYWQRKYGGGLGLFSVQGTDDALRYNTGDPINGSSLGSPKASGYLVEVNYLPIENVKAALRYTGYTKFGGTRGEYSPGREAKSNDTLYLLVWALF